MINIFTTISNLKYFLEFCAKGGSLKKRSSNLVKLRQQQLTHRSFGLTIYTELRLGRSHLPHSIAFLYYNTVEAA